MAGSPRQFYVCLRHQPLEQRDLHVAECGESAVTTGTSGGHNTAYNRSAGQQEYAASASHMPCACHGLQQTATLTKDVAGKFCDGWPAVLDTPGVCPYLLCTPLWPPTAAYLTLCARHPDGSFACRYDAPFIKLRSATPRVVLWSATPARMPTPRCTSPLVTAPTPKMCVMHTSSPSARQALTACSQE